ncbi:hypothetical protein [Chamaesiphon sp. VAR_48_metabat_403]|uniref:hypothetical protein n=1 Tax=Chamaesiphon sp. VAR_48_metabat_403 TaxID=2964700 RepID=UPI00286DF29B|nr:hypothetical protein [Chamaesiphon sp. VAR_48_metabat_403]
MLVVIIDNQIIAPQQVCQACLMADRDGRPRWQQGKLGCGRLIRSLNCCSEPQSDTYECQMGFRLVEID